MAALLNRITAKAATAAICILAAAASCDTSSGLENIANAPQKQISEKTAHEIYDKESPKNKKEGKKENKKAGQQWVKHVYEEPEHTFFYAQERNPFAKVNERSPRPPAPFYFDISNSYSEAKWKPLWDGADFQRVDVYKGKSAPEKVDTIAMVRFDPNKNTLKISTGCSKNSCITDVIENWGVSNNYINEKNFLLVNSSYYEAEPWGYPTTITMINGKRYGGRKSGNVRRSEGMLVASPAKDAKGKPNMDLLDKKFDSKSEFANPQYRWAVQGWPILLDRKGNIRIQDTNWQANRSIVAKDSKGRIYAMTTEGGFFTLYNMGRFLKDMKKSGLEIVTAMNLDGGYEADMVIETPKFTYLTYGYFETQGLGSNISFPIGSRIQIPTVIGFLPGEH